MRKITLFVSCLVLVVGFLFTSVVSAEEKPKFLNKNQKFKAISVSDAAKKAKSKLGKPPKLSKKEMKKLQKGEILVREIKGKQDKTTGDAKRFEAIGIVAAPPKSIMSLMKDFDNQVGVMPHLEKVTSKWEGALAHIEHTLKIAFSKFNYKLSILHYGNSFIEWEYVEGDIKETSGYYKFFPLSKGKRTLVVYHVFTDPGIPVPSFILDLLTKNSMPDVIETARKVTVDQKKYR